MKVCCMLQKTDIMAKYLLLDRLCLCVIVDPHLCVYQLKASGCFFFLLLLLLLPSGQSIGHPSHYSLSVMHPEPHQCPVLTHQESSSATVFHICLYLTHHPHFLVWMLCQSCSHPNPNPHPSQPCLNHFLHSSTFNISILCIHIIVLYFLFFLSSSFYSKKVKAMSALPGHSLKGVVVMMLIV